MTSKTLSGDDLLESEGPHEPARHGWWAVARAFLREKFGTLALVVLVVLVLAAALAPVISPYGATEVDTNALLQPPSGKHWFGTDDLGRDILSGTLSGLQVSLVIGVGAGLISALIGSLVGAVAGYAGGWFGALLMRVTDFFLTIPVLFFALLVVSVFGPSRLLISAVIGAIAWPAIARLVRAEFERLRREAFVEAAEGYGMPKARIVVSEILPNTWDIVVVAATVQIPSAILVEAGLSFIGVGVPDPRSLGLMLRDAYSILSVSWWSALFPGLALSLLLVSLTVVADTLNDVLRVRAT